MLLSFEPLTKMWCVARCYCATADLFYLTGFPEPNARLVLRARGPGVAPETCMFVHADCPSRCAGSGNWRRAICVCVYVVHVVCVCVCV